MIQSISVSNYALIDSLEIDFERGFNIITGETGAGKSILLGALSLILGQRADSSVLRDKNRKCVVEGCFSIQSYGLEEFFKAEELDYAEPCILRREITVSGTSRAFINDTPVTAKTLRELGIRLVDIHSQHQNLELGNNQFQLKVVDWVAGNSGLLLEYGTHFRRFRELQNELKSLEELAAQSRADLDYFQFQYKQLDEARLKEQEQQELEEEQEKLTHAEEIQTTFGSIADQLENGEQNLLALIKEMLQQINRVKAFYSGASGLYERLESAYIEMKDIASEAQLVTEQVENNPEKLQQVTERLDLLYSLQQKHRVSTIAELIGIRDELDGKIQQVSSYDSQIELLQKQLQQLNVLLTDLATRLNESRKGVAGIIEQKVSAVLHELGMPHARLVLDFSSLDHFSETGIDRVNFLFSANKNAVPEDIAKVASGGEISRLMLAIKTLLTDAKSLPTIVLDEIDTGISGEVALKTGQIIGRLSETAQVINITHLPQIAAQGTHHYFVYKSDEGEQTVTSIRKLSEEERIVELAKMLGGENYSETALKTAREMLA